MARCLRQAGFQVERASSPWILSQQEDGTLMSALAQGSANAVMEMERLSPADIQSWLKSRQQAQTCEVGHEDLLAIPAQS
jgi:hypothetical protein